jgi:hypothetical protein
MTAGITRKNGTVVAPTQRPSTLTFFQIDFGVDLTTSVGVVNGAYEQAVRACENFATVAMVGTLNATGGTGQGLRIAIEDTGTLSDTGQVATSGLGMGSSSDSVTYASTADALKAAIRALGTTAGVDSKNLTGADVTVFAL